MYRAEGLSLSSQYSALSLEMELVEISTIAGRTMVTGLHDGLRLTAIVDEKPNQNVGQTAFFVLPPNPDVWFAATGERVS